MKKKLQPFRNMSWLKASIVGASIATVSVYIQIAIFTIFINCEYISTANTGVIGVTTLFVSGLLGCTISQKMTTNGRLKACACTAGMIAVLHICGALVLYDVLPARGILRVLVIVVSGACSLLLCNLAGKTAFKRKIKGRNIGYCTK